ncbi:MAG: hypothetical protein V4584_09690 [Verrucomicrobiota bacterium]
MNPLRLSPLPSLRADDESGTLLMEREGFVDEAVVTALVRNTHHHHRSTPYPEDLALAADDLDFAGWRLSSSPPVRGPEFSPQVINAIVRRAAPPMIEEPGLGSPHLGSHRWWLAGLAGVISTMLFSLLLLSLSVRPGSHFAPVLSPRALIQAKVAPAPETPAEKASPELTDVSDHRP